MPVRHEANAAVEQEQAPHQAFDPGIEGMQSMPDSHPEFDPANMTKERLVKICSYFAKVAAQNPELANAQAERVVESIRETDVMRQTGLDEKAIKSQKWASKSQRHKEKIKVEKKVDPIEEIAQTPPQPHLPPKPKHHFDQVQPKPQTGPEFIQPPEDEEPASPKTETELPRAATEETKEPAQAVRVDNPGPLEPVPEMGRVQPEIYDNIESQAEAEKIDERPASNPEPEIVHEVSQVAQEAGDAQSDLQDASPGESVIDEVQVGEMIEVKNVPEEVELPTSASRTIESVPQTETVYDPEIIEIYHELVESVEQFELAEPQTIEDVQTDELFAPAESAAEDARPNHFAEFLKNDQPELEEVLSLDQIAEQANDQALEQTFTQFAEYLSEISLEPQGLPDEGVASEVDDETVKVQSLIEEIVEMLPIDESIDERTGSERRRVDVTPEMTEKLVVLLDSLGYEKPGEVLVEYVRLRGLNYLLQILQHLYEISNPNNQREFSSATFSTATDAPDNSFGFIVGRLILKRLSMLV